MMFFFFFLTGLDVTSERIPLFGVSDTLTGFPAHHLKHTHSPREVSNNMDMTVRFGVLVSDIVC
jgi:hypothetical protein